LRGSNKTKPFPGPLFSPGDAKDKAYLNLGGGVITPENTKAREFVEELWREFYPCADDDFLVQIKENFHSRFWEMYLTCALRHHRDSRGYTIACPKPGPDLLMEHNSQRIWIEAVAVTAGEPGKPDSLVAPPKDSAYQVPDEKIILRYASAIDEKFRKYLHYREKGPVAQDDSYVVAINSADQPWAWADPEIPRILKAVFSLGPLEFVFDRNTKTVVERRHQFRPAVRKVNLAEIPTDTFLTDRCKGISAILHSYASAGTTARPLGLDFVVVHNPMASTPVPLRLIPAALEWHALPTDEGFELKPIEGNPSVEG
jgi:hypothetical protein